MPLLTMGAGSYAQFITVLLLFVLVLGITAVTTRWIANYQKQQGVNENVQVIETTRIANNIYIQIIRVGGKYMVVAVCKDAVTMLGEIPEEQLNIEGGALGKKGLCKQKGLFGKGSVQNFSFKEFLDRASQSREGGAVREKPEEDQSHDEK